MWLSYSRARLLLTSSPVLWFLAPVVTTGTCGYHWILCVLGSHRRSPRNKRAFAPFHWGDCSQWAWVSTALHQVWSQGGPCQAARPEKEHSIGQPRLLPSPGPFLPFPCPGPPLPHPQPSGSKTYRRCLPGDVFLARRTSAGAPRCREHPLWHLHNT